MEESAKFSLGLYRDVNAAARMINQIEWSRRQLEDLRKMLAAAVEDPAGSEAADALERGLREVEDLLMQPTLAEADQKSFRGALGLYLKLVWLAAESGSGGGDVSGNADLAPTRAEHEVYERLSAGLAEARRKFDAVYSGEIPRFNDAMRAKGYAQVMLVHEPEEPRHEEKKDEDEDEDDDWDG